MSLTARIIGFGLLAVYAMVTGPGLLAHAMPVDHAACGCDGDADCCGQACCAPPVAASEPSCCDPLAAATTPDTTAVPDLKVCTISTRCTCGDDDHDAAVLAVAKHLGAGAAWPVARCSRPAPTDPSRPRLRRGAVEPDDPVPRSRQASA
jgi:hypothetical protein